jgi:hypothetical protein
MVYIIIFSNHLSTRPFMVGYTSYVMIKYDYLLLLNEFYHLIESL